MFVEIVAFLLCYRLNLCVLTDMQPSGNFTIPESPPPGYMSEDGEFSDAASAMSSPSPGNNYNSGSGMAHR